MLKKLSINILTLFSLFISTAQETNILEVSKKKINSKKTTNSISIDGVLNEDDWTSVQSATDFVMFEPDNGKSIDENFKTEFNQFTVLYWYHRING